MSSNVSGKLIGGRRVRWDDQRAADAYARGWWVRGTLADSLVEAARRTPERVVLIDGECQLDCRSLYEQASALAQALLARMPTASVVSLMLPNWHEATIIYLAATMAGMVVNPILPSLRDRELLFILNDADTRMVFVPSAFGRHDYASMLTGSRNSWVPHPRSSWCAANRGRRPYTISVLAASPTDSQAADPGSGCGAHDPLHIGDHRPTERCSA